MATSLNITLLVILAVGCTIMVTSQSTVDEHDDEDQSELQIELLTIKLKREQKIMMSELEKLRAVITTVLGFIGMHSVRYFHACLIIRRCRYSIN